MIDEKDLLKQQMITTSIYVICLLVSLSLTYDEYLKQDKKKMYNNKDAQDIAVTNRVIILVLSLSYLYINYVNRENAKNNNKDLNFFNLQLSASALALIASIIVLYVVIKSGDYPFVSSEENPVL